MNKTTGRFLLKAIKIFGLSCCVGLQPLIASGQSNEFRAFWADAFGAGFKSAAEVTTFINNIRAAKANAIVPEIRKRGDAYYNGSIYEPKATDISPLTFDPLADLITKAHDTSGGKQRVEVHAWIVSYKIWSSQFTPPPASTPPHPYNAHPEWLTQDRNGALWDGGSYSFDPGHPDVQRFTFNVCMDIISRYDVDGFNFDYIRYTGNTWGYHPVTVARYNARYGLTGLPEPTDPLWMQFRRDQVTALVRKVYLHTMATKPWVKISADTITWGNSGVANDSQWFSSAAAWNDVLQDWRGWMEEGILDLNIPMNYYRHHNTIQPTDHATAYTNWMNFAKNHRFNRHVAIGPGTYLNYTSNALIQMRATRAPSPTGNFADGVCAYVYKQPDNQGTSFATFKNYLTNSTDPFNPALPGLFSTPADIPPMPWKTTPTKGHLMGTIYGGNASNALDGATVTVSSPSRSQTNDATGFYGFVDLVPGNYTVTASYPGYASVSTNVTVAAGSVATRDMVLMLAGPPAIVAQPQNQTVYAGGLASFVVTASGPGPLSYQWRLWGTNLPGANAPVLTINPATTNHAGQYDLVITNSFGAITSQWATLTVIVPTPSTRLVPLWTLAVGSRPYLTTGSTERGLGYNPASGRLLLVGRAGSAQVYVLDPETTADLHTLSLGSGIISGGTFTLHTMGIADDGAVYVSNLTLNGATDQLRIYRWANDNPGTTPTVAFAGDPSPGKGGRWGDTIDVRGAGTNTQIILGARAGTNIVLLTTSNGSTFTNNPITLSGAVDDAFGLGIAFGVSNTVWGKAFGTPLRLAAYDLSLGTAALLQAYGGPTVANSITAIGVSTNLNILAGVAIETPDNLKVFDLPPAGAPGLVGTNAFATDNENSNRTGAVDFGGDRIFALDSNNGLIALQVLPPPAAPVITTQPASLTVVEAEDAPFSAAASGSAPLYYQWRFNQVNIAGANATNYVRMNAQGSDAGQYTLVVTNAAGAITSQVAILTVNVPAGIAYHPQSLSVYEGQNASFEVVASGTEPFSYQWRFDGTPIPGATASAFTRTNVQLAHAGNYSALVTNLAGTVASQDALLTVWTLTPPQIGPSTVLSNGQMQFSGSGNPGTYTIQFSTNLANWQDLLMLSSTNGAFQWTDAVTNSPRRFYRARWEP